MEPEGTTPPEAIEAAVADAPAEPQTPASTPPAEAPNTSIADAFAQAKAELDGQGEGSKPGEDANASKPGGEQAQEPASEEAGTSPDRTYGIQGSIQRLIDLVNAGREDELTPVERGVFDKLKGTLGDRLRPEVERQIQVDREREAGFKNLYLEHLALEEADPAAYIAALKARPKLLNFMEMYAKDHPEISLETPDAQRMYAADEVEAHTSAAKKAGATEAGNRWVEAAKAIAEQMGVDPEAAMANGKGPGTVVAALVEAAAEARAKALVDQKLPGIIEAERQAALEQATARFVSTEVKAPVNIPGSTRNPDAPVQRAPGTKYSMADALKDAAAELEKAS